MSLPPAPGLDDAAVERKLAEARARRYEHVGRVALTWLALVPEWTDELAERCEFPADGPVMEFASRAKAAALCEIRRVGSAGRAHFWMPASARDQFLRDTKAQPRSRVALADTAATVAERILAADVRVAPAIRNWAEIARLGAEGALRGGDELTRHLREPTRERDAAAALDWIAAGEELAPVLGGDLGPAAARGRRRVDLEYRRRHDVRLLERFVERPDEIAALRRLLLDDGDPWALHLIGMGGVGKTMLLRYLSAGFATAHGLPPFPVGRVDFDHIDPRYPWVRPEQLLVELTDALEAHLETRDQENALDDFVELVKRADEVRDSSAGLEQLDQEPFKDALAGFARFAEGLPQPVVLVLDTCEELAKLHPGDASTPSVDATLRILDDLHRALPEMRVILAGRRPFDPPSGMVRHEVRGFDAADVNRLFAKRGLTPDATVRKTILDASLETGRVAVFRASQPQDEQDERFNPFDVDLYAEWLEEEGALPLDRIGADDSNAYVRLRIVERLHEPGLEHALPAATILGRFDMTSIEPALPSGGAPERERLMTTFAEQEWIEVAQGETPATMVLEIEPRLLPRLRRYYDKRPEFAQAEHDLRGRLQHLLAHGELTDLAIERADAALRILSPVRAALAWSRLETRIAELDRWDWAYAACVRLLADEAGEPRHAALRSAIRATYQAACRHQRHAPDPDGWTEVLETVDSHPVPQLREWLRKRALLGVVGDTARRGDPPAPELLAEVRTLLRDSGRGGDFSWSESLYASAIAALEPLVEWDAPAEWIEAIGAGAVATWAGRTGVFQVSAEARAAAEILAARASSRAGVEDHVADSLARAEAALRELPQRTTQTWIDWVAPGSARDRTRLDLTLIAADRGEHSEERERAWLADVAAGGRIAMADGARFASAAVVAALADSVERAGHLLDGLAQPAVREPAPTTGSHRRVPPLFTARSRLLSAGGRIEEAIDTVHEIDRESRSSRGATDAARETSDAARAELLRLLRRHRFAGQYGPLIARSAERDATRQAACEAAALIVGPRALPAWRRDAADAHLQWRCGEADGVAIEPLLEADREGIHDPLLAAHVSFDLREAELLTRWSPAAGARRLPETAIERLWLDLADDEWRGCTTGEPYAASWARIALRAWALADELDVLPEAIAELPPRRRGELALEEGELLALRLPGRALPLLHAAEKGFDDAGDRIGTFVAATTAALTAFRSDDEKVALRWLDRARSAKAELAKRGVLPGPDEEERTDGVWEDWLRRLDACERWAAGDRAFEGEVAEIRLLQDRVVGSRRKAAVPKEPDTLREPPPPPAGAEFDVVADAAETTAADSIRAQVAPVTRAADVTHTSEAHAARAAEPGPLPEPVLPPPPPRRERRPLSQAAAAAEADAAPPPHVAAELAPPARPTPPAMASRMAATAAPDTARTAAGPRVTRRSRRRRLAWILALAIAVALPIAFMITDSTRSPAPTATSTPRDKAPPTATPSSTEVPNPDIPTPSPATTGTASPAAQADGGAGIALAGWISLGAALAAVLALATLVARRRASPLGPMRCQITPGPGGHARVQLLVRRPFRRVRVARDMLVDREPRALPGFVDAIGSRRRLPLAVHPALAGPPWEQHLRSGRDARPTVWRVPPTPRHTSRPIVARPGEVTALAAERWLLFLDQAWAAAGRAVVLGDPERAALHAVIHLVGIPALTADGWCLKLDDERRGTVTRAADAPERLVTPDAVPASAAFVVVQGAPGRAREEAAGGLRGFAAQVFEGGAHAVLVIPSLPPRVATEAAGSVAAALPRGRLGRRQLFNIADACRASAPDTCLYAPERG